MAKADTSVKWFHSGMADAPVLSGQAGKLIELLDACLINGFSTRTPDSIVVADGVATVSISAGNPYEKHAVIAISGASVAALNAQWRIDTSVAASFTFRCPGVADGTASGATVKRAAAGWGKPFSATNVAVYQSLDPTGTQLYLRVNDADPRYARVRGYEQMTDANTGAGLFPTIAQVAEGIFTWMKSTSATGASREWSLVADGAFFWFFPRGEAGLGGALNMFGDFVAFSSSDKYNTIIAAHHSAEPASNRTNHPAAGGSDSSYPRYVARALSQTGEAYANPKVSPVGPMTGSVFAQWDGGIELGPTLPPSFGLHGASLLGGPCMVHDGGGSSSDYRGYLPGVAAAFFRETLPTTGVVETAGKAFLRIATAPPRTTNGLFAGVTYVDVTGPWR